MGEGEFRGDADRLESQIEEMAHVVYGLPKNDLSKSVAKNVANQLLILSAIKFEKEEEPIRPLPPVGGRGVD